MPNLRFNYSIPDFGNVSIPYTEFLTLLKEAADHPHRQKHPFASKIIHAMQAIYVEARSSPKKLSGKKHGPENSHPEPNGFRKLTAFVEQGFSTDAFDQQSFADTVDYYQNPELRKKFNATYYCDLALQAMKVTLSWSNVDSCQQAFDRLCTHLAEQYRLHNISYSAPIPAASPGPVGTVQFCPPPHIAPKTKIGPLPHGHTAEIITLKGADTTDPPLPK